MTSWRGEKAERTNDDERQDRLDLLLLRPNFLQDLLPLAHDRRRLFNRLPLARLLARTAEPHRHQVGLQRADRSGDRWLPAWSRLLLTQRGCRPA